MVQGQVKRKTNTSDARHGENDESEFFGDPLGG